MKNNGHDRFFKLPMLNFQIQRFVVVQALNDEDPSVTCSKKWEFHMFRGFGEGRDESASAGEK